ncbi:hypothetical protein LCGC14_2519470 [marine sediment metagenome]|uniref:Uncharacterized protein n=1 Tax=marine sediment metagenome TaxID=412755 RepID=A0A0F9DQ41_9ZZZZ
MSRNKRSADIEIDPDVEVSEVEGAVEDVEIEQVPEVAPVESPEKKPAPRGVGGEYITRDGKLTQS